VLGCADRPGDAPSNGVHSDLQHTACIQWPAAHAPGGRSGICHRTLVRFCGRHPWVPVIFKSSVFVLCVLCGWCRHGCIGRPAICTAESGPCRLAGRVMVTVLGCDYGGCDTA